ncbi:MAG: DUF2892 domain-containing protein [Gammaproteobacteria bacterium]|jgi:hypothetical protein|nr:DUF2892 domain-containing protein [Gammaproteobacteria bacterium]
MKVNMAPWDRAARVVLGLILIVLGLTGTIGLWGWIGVVPVLTGLVGSCPLYSILGIKTCKSCS